MLHAALHCLAKHATRLSSCCWHVQPAHTSTLQQRMCWLYDGVDGTQAPSGYAGMSPCDMHQHHCNLVRVRILTC